MKISKLVVLAVILSFVLGPVSPALAQPAGRENSPASPQSPENYPILVCPVTGITSDLANSRGIRFTVSQNFTAVEVRLTASISGSFTLQAELRRSTGFTDPILATTSATVTLPSGGSLPYKPVTFTFSPINVSGAQTFTLKFSITSGNGSVYFETAGIGNQPCPNVEETEENNVANPTVRGDPTGFKVLAASPSTLAISSAFTATPPVLDGKISPGEWDISNQIPFENGFLTVRNDAFRLYILLDVLYDTVDNTGAAPDYFWVAFDKNQDKAITPDVDLMYNLTTTTGNIRYQWFTGPNSWTGLQPATRSARGRSFGCFIPDGTLYITMHPMSFTCRKHVVWEVGIDLAEISAAAGGKAMMGFKVSSPSPDFTNDIPVNFTIDFTNLITVNLGAASTVYPAPTPGAVITLNTKPIEVTQAIQDRDNTLPLVTDKDTVARVYVNVSGTATSQPTLVYLYGSQGGVDLPGSPLLRYFGAPLTVNRSTTGNTANFTLPKSWTSGIVSFGARVRDWFGNENARTIGNLTFHLRESPTYWVVPINTGSSSSPVLISNTEIASQESYLRAVYPVPYVTFIKKAWSVIGPTTVNNTIAELNTYYSNVVMAWILGFIFGGHTPFTLPDQIYGFTPSGGGISDPTWIGARGMVAHGYRGSSREGTMAHEINHNLDRSAAGTWGRHVGDPTTLPNGDPVDNHNWGCGAAGPDPNWPVTGDDSIWEVGFDTRTASFGAVPSTYPDFMSYCQSPGLPTKWTSPYRWNNEYGVFSPPVSANQRMLELAGAQQYEDVFYVSGHIDETGTGGLNPIIKSPGYPSTFPQSGNAILEELGPKGEVLGSFYMEVSFPHDEEEPVTTFLFNVQLPILQGATSVRLIYNKNTLDQITASNNPPTVEVTSPNGGENWTGGIHTVNWSASDLDGDKLTFSLLYTPDDGSTWYPVVSGLTGNSYALDTSTLPSGQAARMRVIASDGFYTAQDDSDGTFILAGNPIQVSITSPAPDSTAPLDLGVDLTGDATSLDDPAIPDENFVWSIGADLLGAGRDLHVQLPVGAHTLTLTVTDAVGNSASASITVFVGPRALIPLVRR